MVYNIYIIESCGSFYIGSNPKLIWNNKTKEEDIMFYLEGIKTPEFIFKKSDIKYDLLVSLYNDGAIEAEDLEINWQRKTNDIYHYLDGKTTRRIFYDQIKRCSNNNKPNTSLGKVEK